VTDTMHDVSTTLARRAWTLFEPIHAIVYFASEAPEHYKAAGLRGGWMGYFASRSAPMGAVTPGVVTAVFHNFQPAMVARAIPDAWHFSSPELALTARIAVADSALRRLWGDEVESVEVAAAATAAMAVAHRLSGAGRPLYAATAGLDEPEVAHLKLWHACTLLREHRFDGHVAALTSHGLDGLESLVTALAAGNGIDPPTIRRFRGWSEEEWDAGVERLKDRGILDAAGALTAGGRALRIEVEATTDRLASDVWDTTDEPSRAQLFGRLRRLATLLESPDGIFYPNPIGVTRPV
jgi:hypothetical protein